MTTRNKKRLAWTLLVILALCLGFVAYNAYTNKENGQQQNVTPIGNPISATTTEQPVSDRSTAITGDPIEQPTQVTEQPAQQVTPPAEYIAEFGGVKFRVDASGVWHEIKDEDANTEVTATEVPATEVPATEAPVTQAPATEIPATEVPTTQQPTEVPATQQPTQQPTEPQVIQVNGRTFLIVDGVAYEIPATEEQPIESPATEEPVVTQQPTTPPATEIPVTQAPATEVPATEIPATQQPTTPPVTEVPATQLPTEAPAIIVVTPTDPPVVSATEVPATQQPITQEPTQSPVQPPVTGLTPEQQTALNNVQTQIYAASAAGEVLPDFDVTGSEDLWAYLPNVDYIPANALYSVLRPYFVDVVAHSFNFVFSEAEGQEAEVGLLVVLESAQAGNGRLRLANDSANAEKMAALLDKCDPTVASYIMLEWLNEHTVQNPENPAERLFLCTR